VFAAFLFAGSAVASCGGLIAPGEPGEELPPPVPMMEHPKDPDPCATGAFCFDAQLGAKLQPLTLGGKLTINTAVVLSNQLKGQTVEFSIVTAVQSGDLLFEVSPKSVVVDDSFNVPVSISLQLPTTSAFDGTKPITLHAEVMGPSGMSGDSVAVNIPVDPKLVVEYSGKGGMATPHTWTIPGSDPMKIGSAGQAAPTMVKLRQKGVQVAFVNKDSGASHILHCSGAIPHQPTDKPTPPNGMYNPLVQTAGGASCYDHNLESQSVAVYFQFTK
jgi:hypothetical protein